jgi:phosphate butyryltransferase
MKSFDEVLAAARQKGKSRVAIPLPHQAVILEGVKEARDLGVADSVLLGDPDTIREIARDLDFDLSGTEILPAGDQEEACHFAARLVADGQADAVWKGSVDTKMLLHEILDEGLGLRTGRLLSHVSVLESERFDRLFYISDGGVNIEPDLQEKVEITKNAVWVAHRLGIPEPKVALLAAIEKVNPKITATVDADEIARNHPIEGALVSGPMALDAAVNEEAARLKEFGDDPVAGSADVLIGPDINMVNNMVRAMMFFGGAKWSGVVVGAKVPVILTSRADVDPGIRIRSVAVAACVGVMEAASNNPGTIKRAA